MQQKVTFCNHLGFIPSQCILECHTKRLRAETSKQRGGSYGMRCELQALVFNTLVSGSQMLPGELQGKGESPAGKGDWLFVNEVSYPPPTCSFILSLVIHPSLFTTSSGKSLDQLLLFRGAQLTLSSPETALNASLQLDSFGTIEIRRKCYYTTDPFQTYWRKDAYGLW